MSASQLLQNKILCLSGKIKDALDENAKFISDIENCRNADVNCDTGQGCLCADYKIKHARFCSPCCKYPCRTKNNMKIRPVEPLDGLKMYLERTSTFCKANCKCRCCCSCYNSPNQTSYASETFPARRPICHKLSFLDDPPYNVAEKPDVKYFAWNDDICKWECDCNYFGNSSDIPYRDEWNKLPQIKSVPLKLKFTAANKRGESYKTCINYRNALPKWIMRNRCIH